jgi:hypothetical protein
MRKIKIGSCPYFLILFFIIFLFYNSVTFGFNQDFIKNLEEENAKIFFNSCLDEKTYFPYDHLIISENGKIEKIGKYTSPTIIGLWLVYLTDIAKGDVSLSYCTPEKAFQILSKAINNLEKIPKWKGFYYWYDLKKGKIKVAEDYKISTHDNGNLAICLAIVAGAFSNSQNLKEKEIYQKVIKLLKIQKQGWQKLYDKNKGLLYGAWEVKRKRHVLNFWIDRFYTEGRISALMGIILGGLPPEIFLNLKKKITKYKLSNGEEIEILIPYQGAFQAWLPLLFIPEDKWSKKLKIYHQNYAKAQIDYAKNSGLCALRSACADPNAKDYRYEPFIGIPNASEEWVRTDIGTPHATALLYPIYPDISLKFLKLLEEKFPQIKGPFGLYDSISEKGKVKKIYLSLDQLQLLLSFLYKKNQNYFLKYLKSIQKLNYIKLLYIQNEK